MAEQNLKGKVVLITGGAGGVGAATAERLAAAGASVAVADIRKDAALKVAEQLREKGFVAQGFGADVALPEQIEALDSEVSRVFGGIDILINNAANLSEAMRHADGKLLDLSLETWDAAFATNVRGAMLLSKYALRHILARGGGVIVNVSSGSATIPNPFGQTAYGATKGALNSLTRYIASQYGKDNIRCNAVLPGLVLSDTAREVFTPEKIADIESRTMVGRASDPADIAAYIHFLVSDDARQISGQLVQIDGGRA